jgi:hypothetical protein
MMRKPYTIEGSEQFHHPLPRYQIFNVTSFSFGQAKAVGDLDGIGDLPFILKGILVLAISRYPVDERIPMTAITLYSGTMAALTRRIKKSVNKITAIDTLFSNTWYFSFVLIPLLVFVSVFEFFESLSNTSFSINSIGLASSSMPKPLGSRSRPGSRASLPPYYLGIIRLDRQG